MLFTCIYVNMQHIYIDMQQSYINMLHNYVNMQVFFILHINIIVLHVDGNKSHVSISMLPVDIIHLAWRGQEDATIHVASLLHRFILSSL